MKLERKSMLFSLAMFKLKHGKVTLLCVDIAAAFNSCM